MVTADTHATAVELLELPDVIRGYEEIKLRNAVLYRKRAEAILKRLRAGRLRRARGCSGRRPTPQRDHVARGDDHRRRAVVARGQRAVELGHARRRRRGPTRIKSF